MKQAYEEIVKEWYVKMRGNFTNLLMDKYNTDVITLEDAENIYQDIFVAIHKNLEKGSIRYDTDWNRYIIAVGLNMAGKKYRHLKRRNPIPEVKPDREALPGAYKRSRRISELLEEMSEMRENPDLCSDPDAQALLGDELTHTPEPCASIIRMTYYSNMTDREISEELSPYRDNGKPTAVNAKAIKARRWLCMRDLIYRVKMALYNAGISEEKPEKKKSNGKKH